ncbi:MAG: AMP-dependent synthetase [Syntrophus sp. (in: bacteria)]|nr:AMP-dependent synthetase [Syntrophus sp. (in: bacteria)]
MNIMDIVAKWARNKPDDAAFVEVRPVSGTRDQVSWAQFDERTNRLANSLQLKGIQKGEKIFLMGKNSIQWLEAFFGILKAGVWAVPLNFRFTDDDIRYCARVAEPSAFIFDGEYAERIAGIQEDLPTVSFYSVITPEDRNGVESLESFITRGSPLSLKTKIEDEDECALYFTSGTTGAPKPVLLKAKSQMCIAVTEATNHGFNDRDRFLMMPPLYHLAIGHLLGAVVGGASSVLLTEQISPKFIIEAIARERLSVVFLLVPWAGDLLQALDRKEIDIKDYDLGCLRKIFMGAQPVPPSLVQRLKEYFPNVGYDTVYGLSETAGPGVVHLGVENERKIGAIGKPNILWDVRIVDENGQDVKRGDVGEVILKGAGVMKEYYRNPELTAKVIQDGWLYTGDLGRIDEESFIYLVDRKKDLVITGGENVYPVEIEDVIRKHHKVADVAVIGIPDDRLGELVTAVIQARQGEILDEEEMKLFCEQQLPRYKRPRLMIFAEVPRNPAGKIEKPKLRQLYSRPNNG